jgi:hypothetical protein
VVVVRRGHGRHREHLFALDDVDSERLSDLSQVALAIHPIGLLARAGQRRQQHADQHGNDADDHKQFDQGEP